MTKKLLLSLSLCCLLLLGHIGLCSAGEYQIQGQELTRLEQIFNQLEINW